MVHPFKKYIDWNKFIIRRIKGKSYIQIAKEQGVSATILHQNLHRIKEMDDNQIVEFTLNNIKNGK